MTAPDLPGVVPDQPGIDCAINAAAKALAADTGVDYSSLSGRGQARWRERAEVTVRAWQEDQRQVAEETVPEPRLHAPDLPDNGVGDEDCAQERVDPRSQDERMDQFLRASGERQDRLARELIEARAALRSMARRSVENRRALTVSLRNEVWILGQAKRATDEWNAQVRALRAERDEALADDARHQSELTAEIVKLRHHLRNAEDEVARLATERDGLHIGLRKALAGILRLDVDDPPPSAGQLIAAAGMAMLACNVSGGCPPAPAAVPDTAAAPLTEAKLKYFVRLAMTVAASAEDPESWPYGRMRRMIDTVTNILGWELGVAEPPLPDPDRSGAPVKRCESPSPGNWPCPSCGAAVDEACQQVAPASVRRPDEPDGDHQYVSTACDHGLHSDCRLTCKWCHTGCLCSCHAPDPGDVPAPAEPTGNERYDQFGEDDGPPPAPGEPEPEWVNDCPSCGPRDECADDCPAGPSEATPVVRWAHREWAADIAGRMDWMPTCQAGHEQETIVWQVLNAALNEQPWLAGQADRAEATPTGPTPAAIERAARANYEAVIHVGLGWGCLVEETQRAWLRGARAVVAALTEGEPADGGE